jgi:hypothetical protein
MRARKRERRRSNASHGAEDKTNGDRQSRDAAGRGGAQARGAKAGGRNNRGRRSGQQGRGKPRNRPPEPVGPEFWGERTALPPARTDVRFNEDPAAVPRSLGTPPLPGQEALAGHYFAAVYDRAVATAGALAAAGGLIEPDDLDELVDDER